MGTLDDLLSGGGKSFKFDAVGATVTGTIVSLDVKQKTEFGTGKALTWDDGRPQEQIVVGVKTDLRDPDDENDDGVRSVYIKGWGDPLKAFKAAATLLGRKPAVGDTFTASYTGDGQANGLTPPKVFRYTFVAGSPVDRVLDTPTAAAPVVAQAPPAIGSPSQADIATAKTLLAAGLTDDTVLAAAPSLTPSILNALRNAA